MRSDGNDGLLDIEGAIGTVTASNQFAVGADGTVAIEPTASGASGLTTIAVTGGVTLAAGSTLAFDPSSSTPSVSESWDLIRG